MIVRRVLKSIILIVLVIIAVTGCRSKNNPPDRPSLPSGSSTGSVDSPYTFSSKATDPDDDNVAIRFSWGDGTFSNWSSYVSSGNTVSKSHTYSSGGTYYIEAQAKDEDDTCSVWSKPHAIIIERLLDSPSTPSGPSSGYVGVSYTFSSYAVDTVGNAVAIRFAWGDGDTSSWSNWVERGDTVQMAHSWSSSSTYILRTQLKDVKNKISDWSSEHNLVISGGGNIPPNTPSTPLGPSNGYVGTSYSFSSSTTDPDSDDIAIRFAWGDGDTSSWSSYVPSGNSVTMSHSWSSSGTYYIRAQAKDVNGAMSGWSASHSIIISGSTNNPPNTPSTPLGPSSGSVGSSYTFSSSTTDPDGDDIAIRFAWGDGDTSSWSSWVPSGDTISISHSYSLGGTYKIRAQAKDINNALSNWSSEHSIAINTPPNTPSTPSGPSSGNVGISYNFSSSATDPDGDDIAIRFAWGDGDTSSWSSYVPSGNTITMSHLYSLSGTYYIRAQARDVNGALSGWSSSHSIQITGDYWTTKADMPFSGSVCVGVVNGKIYAIGDDRNEEYNPVTNTWTTKAPILTYRYGFATGVVNDKIYAIGGSIDGMIILSTNEMYNPITNSWSTKADMPTPRMNLAIGVVNNKIYAIGGYDPGRSTLSINEEYNPSTNTWITKALMPTDREACAIGVANDKIYAIGGVKSNNWLSTNEEYDPLTNTWTTRTSMPTPRVALAIGVVNSKIYAIGGYNVSNRPSLSINEMYDPVIDTWTTKTSMPTPRRQLGIGVVNYKIYAIGGGLSSANEEYTP